MDRIPDRSRPRPEWFAHDPDGIHGIAHAARVLVWAEQVAAWMHDHGRPVDAEVVRCAAAPAGRVEGREESMTEGRPPGDDRAVTRPPWCSAAGPPPGAAVRLARAEERLT